MGGLGWSEILIILVIALIIFGPRKLPELGKTLGNSLAQFRRASDDFKRQWEDEVESERRRIEPPPVEQSDYYAAMTAPLEETNNSSGEPAHIAAANEAQPDAAGDETTSSSVEPAHIAEASETSLDTISEAPAIAHHEETLHKETKRDWM